MENYTSHGVLGEFDIVKYNSRKYFRTVIGSTRICVRSKRRNIFS